MALWKARGKWGWLEANAEIRKTVLFAYSFACFFLMAKTWTQYITNGKECVARKSFNGGHTQLIKVSGKRWNLETVEGLALPSHCSGLRGCALERVGTSSEKWGQDVYRILVQWLLLLFCFICFFLSLNDIVIQGGVATRKDPNSEQKKKEMFKAGKTLLSFGTRGRRGRL